MTRSLHVLVLAIAAMLAITAVTASTARAVAPEFHCTSTSANCWLTSRGGTHETGSNSMVFSLDGGNLACTGNTEVDGTQLKITLSKTASLANVADAVLTGCKLFGIKASVNMEGCTFSMSMVSASSPAKATTGLACPAGKSVTITPTGLSCTVTIGAQTGLGYVTFENGGGTEPTYVTAVVSIIEGLLALWKYVKTGTECPGGAGSKEDGEYTGSIVLKAYEDNNGAMGNNVGWHVF